MGRGRKGAAVGGRELRACMWVGSDEKGALAEGHAGKKGALAEG